MVYQTAWRCVFLVAVTAFVLTGCKKTTTGSATAALPVVPVSEPVQRMVSDYVEYTGRLDARQSVGVKARATGFLDSIGKDSQGNPIKEGSEVKKGDLLFQIDPRPYKYQLAQATSQVAVVERQLKLAQILLGRAKESLTKNVGSQQDVDQSDASVAETQARLEAAKTTVQTYQLNLDFASVTASISGQISRFYYYPGNLIVQDQTLLTTIVDVEQVYAYFDMDERTLLKINGQVSAGKIKPPVGTTKVLMSLEGETDYPHVGSLDFINNVVNPATGTISVRAVYDNPKSASGTRLFVPGMFVRIRLPIGEPHPGLLVVDRAIASDQGLKYVFVVDAQNKTQYRRVVTGALQDDGLRVIEPYQAGVRDKVAESGLKPDERVVVGSLPQLRPQMEISPENVPMPTPGAPSMPQSQAPAPTDKK
jgi:multidrug efflux system membrane fusion protein